MFCLPDVKMDETETDVTERFHIATDEDIRKILEEKDSKNTKKATRMAVKCFRDFLIASKRTDTGFEDYTIEELNTALKSFYVGARKADGTLFKKSALQNIRYGIKRYIKEKRNMDILNHERFIESNEVFKAVSTDLKRKGLGKVDHHPPISENDLRSLYSGDTPVFNTETPYGLQRKVWFELTLFLCRRGRENLRTMKKDTFRLGTDDTGRKFIYQFTDELDKNHRLNTQEAVTEGRMYELQGNRNCPVSSFLKYLSKLHPRRDDLWQRPKDMFNEDDDVWYINAAVGKNSLSDFMAEISKIGKLSIVYRNHSVRATSITIMDLAGISSRHIMKVSRHKSETSLKSYSNFVSVNKKREISDTLSSALGNVPVHSVQNNIPELFGDEIASVFNDDFDMEEIDENHLSDPNLNNILSGFNSNKAVVETKNVSSHGCFAFNANFSDNCNVTINININK